MSKWAENFFDGVDTFLAWLSSFLKQYALNYCDLETADSETVLVNHDGTLVSILEIHGITELIGQNEFNDLISGLENALHGAMGRPGYAVQIYFSYEKENIKQYIENNFKNAQATAQRLELDLHDLFKERIEILSRYCGLEKCYVVLFTRPFSLPNEQLDMAAKEKINLLKETKTPGFIRSQNIFAAYPEMRNNHDAYVQAFLTDLAELKVVAKLLTVHDAVHCIRESIDPDFTSHDWRACLPGDTLSARELQDFEGDISDVFWPNLSKQIIPRDGEIYDRRTVKVGDRIYSSIYIDLFPKDVKPFMMFFSRVLPSHIPWRMSFLMESEGLATLKFKGILSAVLAFSSTQNKLISDSVNLLNYLNLSTDETLVRLRVVVSTYAPEKELSLLRRRTSELVKAIQGWGTMDVSEVCGDPFAGFISTSLATTLNSPAVPTVGPLSQILKMMPWTRPASPWESGALLFRTPDGKPWPFQPGSTLQTTWIDLVYARPGSGKSVLANAQNLGLCLLAGIPRLPRISIIDIGPSSSGLISLLKEALPPHKRHLAAHFRLQMLPEYAINPFDTQLGFRFPTALERAFLLNFLTLLATPIGAPKSYDGMTDLVGMVIDEMYRNFSDEFKATPYSPGVDLVLDSILEEIGFIKDAKSTWWEITDVLFSAGLEHEAGLAQRYAMPLLSDAVSVCRSPAIEDLYGKITTPTGETLLNAFSRMISSVVREYPILSRITAFDLGESRVVALDLDEVAKTGGDAADRQTAVMYMLARYILARHYYLTEDVLGQCPEQYLSFHRERIREIREDPKRIVYDEFHRTSKSQAVRDQVLVDMREGRKWNVQISLLSQAIEDFDSIMIDFATAIYIMDAGPTQTVEKTTKIFGLNETAKMALKNRVHGPRAGGGTFLVQYSTKVGLNVQLLTLTLGPIELWAFSTTAEDVIIRNHLYRHLGPMEARRYLAILFPGGTATKELAKRFEVIAEEKGLIKEEQKESVLMKLVNDILASYTKDPNKNVLAVGVS